MIDHPLIFGSLILIYTLSYGNNLFLKYKGDTEGALL